VILPDQELRAAEARLAWSYTWLGAAGVAAVFSVVYGLGTSFPLQCLLALWAVAGAMCAGLMTYPPRIIRGYSLGPDEDDYSYDGPLE
jgi:hypothetical protein